MTPFGLALLGVLALTASFVDPVEPMRCLSSSCVSADVNKCQQVKKENVVVMDECESCGESYTLDPLGKIVVLRTCELEPCMGGKGGLVQLKGPKTYAAIRCCHEEFCNNGTMPAIPFSEELPVIEGVEDMKKHDPTGGKH